MSDRTSAGIFARVFEHLADAPAMVDRNDLARWLWRLSWDYDFSQRQLEVDRALLLLNLARPLADGGCAYADNQGALT